MKKEDWNVENNNWNNWNNWNWNTPSLSKWLIINNLQLQRLQNTYIISAKNTSIKTQKAAKFT